MNQSQRNPGVQKGAEGGGRKGKGVKAKAGQLFLLVDPLGKGGLPGLVLLKAGLQGAVWQFGGCEGGGSS